MHNVNKKLFNFENIIIIKIEYFLQLLFNFENIIITKIEYFLQLFF